MALIFSLLPPDFITSYHIPPSPMNSYTSYHYTPRSHIHLTIIPPSSNLIHRQSSQKRSSKRHSSSRTSRHKEDDEIPLVELDGPTGELDTISENELAGFRNQIKRLSISMEKRKSDSKATPTLV